MPTRVAETPLDCSTDLFFKLFKEKAFRLTDVCGAIVQKIELVDGTSSWVDVVGTRKRIYFTPSPARNHLYLENIMYEVQAVDNSNNKIVYKVLQGAMLHLYKNVVVTFEVTAASTAKWTIQYEKLDPSNKDPDVYTGLLGTVNNNVNTYIRYGGEV
ncbi:unnamed protein product [Dovyalis caffra]|uniref:Bet v I/Major latex protein domain-containing protein n=1 Tax=Dovyalis caffra TaxID=77055 RepID=A0AAV1SI84_9ROSI|nr:unnamed protein product [Dovyalis caffra]